MLIKHLDYLGPKCDLPAVPGSLYVHLLSQPHVHLYAARDPVIYLFHTRLRYFYVLVWPQVYQSAWPWLR
jgi:hypothetical protein